LKRSDIDSALKMLLGKLPDKNDGYGCQPLGYRLFIMCNKNYASSLRKIKGFVPLHKYPYPEKSRGSEFGSIGNFRILLTSKLKPDGGVYELVCFGIDTDSCNCQEELNLDNVINIKLSAN